MDLQKTAKSQPCGHVYHFECLNTWIQTSSQCPTCRTWLDSMTLASGVVCEVKKKEQSGLDFQPPTPPLQMQQRMPQSGPVIDTCVTCLNEAGAVYMLCESCSTKFHSNCHDGEFCPNCGWDKFHAVSAARGIQSAKNARRAFDGDENRMYSRMVDEIKRKKRHEQKPSDAVDHAWGMLDMALKDLPEEAEAPHYPQVKQEPQPLKRPKLSTHHLTANALAKHDISNGNIPKKHTSARGLTYIQKLIIYRLLIKPRIPSSIPVHQYTKLSKNISHKIYALFTINKYAMLALNSLIEFSEREGIVLKDKKSIDLLHTMWKDNSIVESFTSGAYFGESGQDSIQKLIQRLIQDHSN